MYIFWPTFTSQPRLVRPFSPMMLASTLFESGYCSTKPFRPKVRGYFCQALTMRASALKGDWPDSSSWKAARRIFSGTVHSAMVFTGGAAPGLRWPALVF